MLHFFSPFIRAHADGFHIHSKGTTMKIDHLNKAERNEIAKRIEAMSDQEARELLDQLNAARTYTRLEARIENANYLKDRMTKKVAAELRRLGLEDDIIKASAKKFSVYEVDKAMKAAGWDSSHKMAFKSELSQLKLLAE
jgi:glutamyl-tRNA reductase